MTISPTCRKLLNTLHEIWDKLWQTTLVIAAVVAPVIKWQRWDSASYDWFGTASTDALPALEAELDAWIASVNGNASNVGRQVTKERGYADSTSSNYAGLVISCGANGNADKGYMQYYTHGSTTSRRVYMGDAFTDDTSRGGYGTVSGGVFDTGVSWYTSGQEASWVLTYDTTDGEEFFNFGPSLGTAKNTSYQDGFTIFKGTDGEWSLVTGDATAKYHVHYFDDAIGTEWTNCARNVNSSDRVRASTTYSYDRYHLYTSVSAGNSANPTTDGRYDVYAASPYLFDYASSSSYNRTGDRRVMTTLGTGDNVYMLTSYYAGPSVLIDLRS